MAANQIVGLALQAAGHTVNYATGMLSNYVNYKIQKAALKQRWTNAKANAKVMTDNANAALSALSDNEFVMSREHNRRLAEIESSFAASGVSMDLSASAQAVYDRQIRNNAEELTQMREQTDSAVGNLILNRDNMLTEAEAAYKWGTKANRYNAVFDAISMTTNFIGNLGAMDAGGGSGGGSGDGWGSGMGSIWSSAMSAFGSGGGAAG